MKKTKKRGSRTGFTTGACAAAAARAAVQGLVSGRVPDDIECQLPNGRSVWFAVTRGRRNGNCAHAVVIKDAGDDPDCTDGAQLTADVRMLPAVPSQVLVKGGIGVGKVTLPGLGLTVGDPAINPVPQRNIEDNIRAVADTLLMRQGLEVTLSVPGGEVMAKKTLNARLGIIGGISILGTTGIVRPWSTSSFRASVIQGIEVAAAQGQDTVVLSTGGRTEKFTMHMLPHLTPVCFVQMGDFLSDALDTAVKSGIRHVVIGAMIGKLTKMAQGETITHADHAMVNIDLLAKTAHAIGAPPAICNAIRQGKTARYAAELLQTLDLSEPFYCALAQQVVNLLSRRYPQKFLATVLVCDFSGNKVAEATGNLPHA